MMFIVDRTKNLKEVELNKNMSKYIANGEKTTLLCFSPYFENFLS